MSCVEGKPCEEARKRRHALAILGLMGLIFLVLSAWSFLDTRGQTLPADVHYAGFDAVQGKRVFQSYNCMGCHTIVGNGAYFGPDLSKLYGKVGPAWLEAFLPSAGAWPTSGAVKLQLQRKEVAGDAEVDSIDAYLAKYAGANERVERRGGHPTLMPNLPLTRTEIGQLIAFLKYTSAMNTEGWPPKPKVDGLAFSRVAMPAAAHAAAAPMVPGAHAAPTAQLATSPAPAASPVEEGSKLVRDFGCTACHSPDRKQLVGPGWGGLYDADVHLSDGRTVKADDAYLTESIVDPDAKIVAGFSKGAMPSFSGALDAGQVAAIVAYIRSLQGN